MPSSPAMTRGYPNDWIELYNTTEDSIDISGWFLSNKGATELDLMNYQIPDETIIPSDDYVVFTQNDHFGACFTLSKNGDCVYLSSAVDTGGHLTRRRISTLRNVMFLLVVTSRAPVRITLWR